MVRLLIMIMNLEYNLHYYETYNPPTYLNIIHNTLLILSSTPYR